MWTARHPRKAENQVRHFQSVPVFEIDQGWKLVSGALLRPLGRKRPMASGTVKWFNATKGFGFIQPDSGGKDVFVHISAVERAGLQGLNEGQKISYEIQTERGREAAVNLKT